VESCRRATVDDLVEIVRLASAMRTELAPMRGGALWLARDARPEPLDDAYRLILERDDALLVVGTIDRALVGFGAVEVETLRSGDRLGVITELFVEPEARAVGVGESMAEALAHFCTERGCIGIDALALPGHRAAKNFFEEQGFTARQLLMHRALHEAE
jgi:ribosomal protein S18 acetylase RimI-like enzyme